MAETKHFLASKTFWFNTIMVLVFLANRWVPGVEEIVDQKTADELAGALTIVGNTVLRFVTRTGVHVTRSKADAGDDDAGGDD